MGQVYQQGSLRRVKRTSGNDVWEWRYRVNGRMKQQMLRVADFPTVKAVRKHLEHSVSALNRETEYILPGAVTMGRSIEARGHGAAEFSNDGDEL